jgi:hypothetical protein
MGCAARGCIAGHFTSTVDSLEKYCPKVLKYLSFRLELPFVVTVIYGIGSGLGSVHKNRTALES